MKGAKNNKQAKNANTSQKKQVNTNNLASRVDALLKQIPKGTFAKTGAAAGAHFGGPMGGAVGGTVGRQLARITGYGDYSVNSNSMVLAGDPPVFANNSLSTVIKHREYITDIVSTGTAFSNTAYDVNPGNSNVFPWLANVATSYQQYKVRGMVFEFKSTSSEYATGSGLGKVIMASNYNVNEPTFANVQEMENSEYAVANKPSVSFYHPVECARGARRDDPFYVKDPNKVDVGTSDNRWYDMLKFQVATTGLSAPAATTIGEIWVTYEIELLKPVVPRLIAPGPSGAFNVFRNTGVDLSVLRTNIPYSLFSGTAILTPVFTTTASGTDWTISISDLPVGMVTLSISRWQPATDLSALVSAIWNTGGTGAVTTNLYAPTPSYGALLITIQVAHTVNRFDITYRNSNNTTHATQAYEMSISSAGA
jgi:hypothetical protein